MASKDEILANFQVCSGIDDVGEAFTRLEAANWNLVDAINSIQLPGVAHGFLPINQADLDVVEVDPVPHEAASALLVPTPGPSQLAAIAPNYAAAGGSEETIHINIQVQMGGLTGNGEFPLEVPVNVTGAELKTNLYQLLGLAPCKQILTGLRGKAVTDATVLTPAMMGPNNTLTLNTAQEGVSFRRGGQSSSFDADVMEIGAEDPVTAPSAVIDASISNTRQNNTNNALRKDDDSSPNNQSAFRIPLKTVSRNKSTNSSSSTSTTNNSSSSFGLASSSKSNSIVTDDSSSGSSASLLSPSTSEEPDRSKPMFILHIKDLTNTNDYTLHFPGHKTVGGVKLDVADVTAIPVHRQQWSGWPDGVRDITVLSLSGIGTSPRLTVKRTLTATARNKKHENTTNSSTRRAAPLKSSSSSSSSDEFEDPPELLQEDDDSFLEEMMDAAPADNKPSSLLPSVRVLDEQECADHFSCQFSVRYGGLAPLFFQGPLREAIDSSISLPPPQRRLLGIYIHHDGSVMSNVFCSQVLCKAATVSFLADNFVLWGWDITLEQHKERLLTNVSTNIGPAAALTARNFRSDQLPAIMVLTRNRGNCEVLSVIYASTSSLDEVVTRLMESVEMFEDSRRTEVAEDFERQSRLAIMTDQDAAYQESLRADRAKAELKRQQEEDEQREVQRQETIKLHEQEMTEKLRASLESELPAEPQNMESPDVTVMRFRPPGAEPFKRAFKLDTALQVVLNFLHVRGFPADSFKFLQSWPRRDLASLNVSRSLKEYSLPQQETITIEER